MKNIFIALIAGLIFVLIITLIVQIVQYILTVYDCIKENASITVTLKHGLISILTGILIAIEIYLTIM